MLDMHTNVKITGIDNAEFAPNSDVFDIPLIRVIYRVKRGRKDYKIWLLPEDFNGTGLFPLCYRRMNQGRYGDVLTMDNQLVFTGKVSHCIDFVNKANKRYFEKTTDQPQESYDIEVHHK